ncbi:hypothetical protein AB1Y20_021713 [Prymnesium parvum]|uniref:PCIF1 WW domain-containing protein n=1 Tax=Prymnesium parvum TaxID=97485 RepID=A0AB34JMA2_PRYPA
MRTTSHSLHRTTKAAPTGLGAQLAGSASLDDVWMASSLPWDPTDASPPPPLPPPLRPRVAALVELRRALELSALRDDFHALCTQHGVAPPMNAFERWRFHSKWEEEATKSSDEPLLPLLPPAEGSAADDGLLADLRRAGVGEPAARQLLRAVRASSLQRAARLARFCAAQRAAGGVALRVRLSAADDGTARLALGGAGTRGALDDAEARRLLSQLSLTPPYMQKLRELYARHAPRRAAAAAAAERRFRLRLLALLLRYHAIGGLGFQAALGGAPFAALQRGLRVNFECFASPLNCYFGAYCSAFPDVDAPFGSRGTFRAFRPRRGSYEVNPPFVDGIIDEMATQLLSLLATAQEAGEPLTFVVVLPGWLDSRGYAALDGSRFLRSKLIVAASDHGFVDGGQHARARSFRESPYDTALFCLQSDGAAAEGPVGECMESVRVALARCTPTAADLARLDARESVRGRSRRVPRPRRVASRRDVPAAADAATRPQEEQASLAEEGTRAEGGLGGFLSRSAPYEHGRNTDGWPQAGEMCE